MTNEISDFCFDSYNSKKEKIKRYGELFRIEFDILVHLTTESRYKTVNITRRSRRPPIAGATSMPFPF